MQFMILKKMARDQHACDIMGTYTACFLGMLIDLIRSDQIIRR